MGGAERSVVAGSGVRAVVQADIAASCLAAGACLQGSRAAGVWGSGAGVWGAGAEVLGECRLGGERANVRHLPL